jgi:glutamyl-tRNA(Gln) amidotransferase subunit D
LVNKLETDVALLKIYPGFNPEIIDHMIKTGTKGFIIEGYGAGNIPTERRSLTSTIKNATNSDIPIVITTQCSLGSSWVYLYDVGVKALEAGALPGYDTLSETALVKLMWVLGQTNELKKVKKMMLTNYAGEITPGMRKIDHRPLWEITQ